MLETVLIAATFLTTFVGVAVFRRWSLSKQLLDVPNERSSHTRPTPRGGGLIIFVSVLFFYSLYLNIRTEEVPVYFVFGAFLIGLISWFDDLYEVHFGWRFLIQTIAASVTVWGLGYWDRLYIPLWGDQTLGLIGIPLTIFWIVWLTNAFNFMDGIDGIAGFQAVIAGFGWYVVCLLFDIEITGMLGIFTAVAGLAFLYYNWPPAKIFMGDVGSAFLGFTYAVIPLLAGRRAGAAEDIYLLPLIAVLLVWPFVFDTVFTFLKRLVRGERVWEAHRKHLYQSLIIVGWSHRAVTILYAAASIGLSIILFFWIYAFGGFGFIMILVAGVWSTIIVILTLFENRRAGNDSQ